MSGIRVLLPLPKRTILRSCPFFLFAGMNGRANGALFAAGVDTIKFPKP